VLVETSILLNLPLSEFEVLIVPFDLISNQIPDCDYVKRHIRLRNLCLILAGFAHNYTFRHSSLVELYHILKSETLMPLASGFRF